MKLSIKQFQELYFIAKSNDEDIDKSIKMVGVVTGLIPEKVEQMNMLKFNKLCGEITKKFELLTNKMMKGKPTKFVHSNGRTYRLHYQIDKKPMNAGKYVEAITFGKDVVENLHKLLATMAEPVKWDWRKFKWVKVEMDHEDIANDMENIDFEVAYHAAVFFYLLYRMSIQVSLPYLVREAKKKGVPEDTTRQLLNDSMSILDGLPMPKWSLITRAYLLNRFGI
jgi:hypothetical protein